jgi:hypothetical protein
MMEHKIRDSEICLNNGHRRLDKLESMSYVQNENVASSEPSNLMEDEVENMNALFYIKSECWQLFLVFFFTLNNQP